MSVATLSVLIHDTSGSVPDVQAADGVVYKTVEFGVGAVKWRHEYAEPSAAVHGLTRIASAMDNAQRDLTVRVTGTTIADFAAKAATLTTIMSGETEITITWNGTILADWKLCAPADYTLGHGGKFDKFGLFALQQEYAFTMPGSPL